MGMKCWNSTFNVQGSRIIIIHVHVRILKIYVAIVEKLKKRNEGVKTNGILVSTKYWV
jgi:hypothetical protein